MRDENMHDFMLAGGTNLALLLGHRKSIDLDFFSYKSFDSISLAEYLKEKYELKISDIRSANTVKGFINGVKIDIIAHIYPLVNEPFVIDGYIRLYSMWDVAAMKLAAISDNGTRLKDFVDIACLSTLMSLTDMLNSYLKKYRNANQLHVLRGLSYFDDINFDVNIELANKHRFSWKKIQERILQMIKFENKIFETEPL
jgi:hypothetical protein